MEDFEKDLRRRIAAEERGTWREALRTEYGPWFDDLSWGFQVGDGWRDVVRDLTQEIADIVGGPDRAPALRVTQVKEKFGGLRFYLLALPVAHCTAIDAAIERAEERSSRTCETCGAGGKLRESAGGWWHTACDAHALD